jgi:hypothetical protein
VPGAAIAVYAGGGVIDDATGVLSKSSGVEATADSVFQVVRADRTRCLDAEPAGSGHRHEAACHLPLASRRTTP